MVRRLLCALILAVFTAGCATLAPSSDKGVIRAKRKVAAALVHIRPVKEVYQGGKREEVLVVGSGFIISADGYVVTNEHVAGESRSVECVLSSKEEVEAKVVGTDPYTDLAVLKLQSDRKDFPTVKLGRSGTLEAGQTVLALGSPHGLARSVSRGIVSVTDRYLGGGGGSFSPYNNWIQTDAAINHGNSGGPLVNLKGAVIGVNTRKLGGAENVGFAIPIDIAKEVIAQIIEHGRVQRSWIGVEFQPMTSKTNDPNQQGVVIGDVDPLSPAFEAGIRPGDVMLSVDEVPTNARFEEDLPAVNRRIADLPIGEKSVIRVLRGADQRDFTVTTVEKSDVKGQEVEFKEWGFTVSDLTPAIVRQAQLPNAKGVVVSGTQVGGMASDAGLQQGDIILRLDDKEAPNLAGFKGMYKEVIDAKKPLVLLDVKRGALSRFVLVKERGPNEPTEGANNAKGDGHGEE